jgi:HAMP domain-containing protein
MMGSALLLPRWRLEGREDVMSGRGDRPLAWVIAFYTAVVLAVGMGGYAVAQYFLTPGRTVVGLVVEHLSHLLVLGVLVYAMLNLVLLRKVVRPISALRGKLHTFAGGDFRPASIESNIREVNETAEAINRMMAKIDRWRPDVSLGDLSWSASNLRGLAQKSDLLDRSTKETLLEAARLIDETVANIAKYEVEDRRPKTRWLARAV